MTTQVRAGIGIAFAVTVLLSAGMFLLRAATSKQDHQTVHVSVAEGATATIHTAQKPADPVRQYRWIVYAERQTTGKGMTIGVGFRF